MTVVAVHARLREEARNKPGYTVVGKVPSPMFSTLPEYVVYSDGDYFIVSVGCLQPPQQEK